jgi:hypothetical protein
MGIHLGYYFFHPGDKNTSKDLKLLIIGVYPGFHLSLIGFYLHIHHFLVGFHFGQHFFFQEFLAGSHFFFQVLLAGSHFCLVGVHFSSVGSEFQPADVPSFVLLSQYGGITSYCSLQSNHF